MSLIPCVYFNDCGYRLSKNDCNFFVLSAAGVPLKVLMAPLNRWFSFVRIARCCTRANWYEMYPRSLNVMFSWIIGDIKYVYENILSWIVLARHQHA